MNIEANLSAAQAVMNSPSTVSGGNSGSNTGFSQLPQQVLMKDYKWLNAYSIPFELQCGILRLELPEIMRLGHEELPEDLTVTVQIYCNQLAMFDPPVSTQFSQTNQNLNFISWDNILPFPIKIKDLSLDSVLVCTVWTSDHHVYAGTTMRLFDDNGCLKQGKQKLLLFREVQGDSNVVYNCNKTPGEYYQYFQSFDYDFNIEKLYENFLKKNSSSITLENTRKDWLDTIFMKRIQQIRQQRPFFNREQYNSENGDVSGLPNTSNAETNIASNGGNNIQEEMLQKYLDSLCYRTSSIDELEIQYYSFLVIEMPTFSYPVFYEDKPYPTVDPHHPPTTFLELLKDCITEIDENTMEFQLTGKHFNPTWLTVVADWDMHQENLCEEQNRRLSHNVRKGAADSTVKPNKEEKARIDRIIQAVNSTQLSSSDMDFLYRFRYSLTENKKALIKFLYVINWDEENEVNELPILLALWRDRAPIDVADALKLLSKDKSFEHPFVREYAVETLRSASDEELLTFLLQLVQALRYEPATNTATTATPVSTPATVHAVTKGLADLSVREGRVPEAVAIPSSVSTASNIPSTSTSDKNPRSDELSPLANFLIERACRSPSVANYLFWYLKVEVEDDNSSELYSMINSSFYTTLGNYNEDTRLWIRRLRAVDAYYHEILSIQNKAKQDGKRRDGKELIFKQLLEKNNLSIVPEFDWVPLPLDPKARISGLKIQTVNMFASAVYPVVVEFEDYDNKCQIQEVMKKQQQQQILSSSDLPNSGSINTTTSNTTASSSAVMKSSKGSNNTTAAASTASTNTSGIKEITHKIIFKSGDDLRQDQLIMQMISLMDSLLKKVNLDLKLVTYGILAVTKKDGIMEFVRNSMPISAVLKNHGSILEYLRLYNHDKSGPFEIKPTTMDTYIKSCAGSCVITYILGIGDRHLDNIMLTRSGELFHIDFGFIFGQDPKPFPPPFRFTRSMADAMGGEDSEHYARFKTYCCQSYNWLRKSANLILNLLSLMGDAGINDISKRSDLSKVLLKVEEKFRPDLTDEQAEQYFLTLISESLHSLAPKLMEVAHKIAVSLR